MKWNKYIDHTLLKPEANLEAILKLCNEAAEYDFASVCVNPCWIETCAERLKGTGVHVCTVIGFPLGAMTSEAKAFEASNAVSLGANEVDMVVNVGMLKSGNYEYVERDIKQVRQACPNIILKVIIECCLLTDEEKVSACIAAKNAGADYVKTSTGFSKWGATVEDVRIMKQAVGSTLKVKAAGGIRSKEEMELMINAGADRIGTSNGVHLV